MSNYTNKLLDKVKELQQQALFLTNNQRILNLLSDLVDEVEEAIMEESLEKIDFEDYDYDGHYESY